VAVFGRRSARQRLKRATEQALSVPTFRMPDDCTPWVLGGVWPAELDHLTADTAPLAEYLKRDLQRIADSANHKLRVLNETAMTPDARAAEQNRVVGDARAFALQRVASTMRQLGQQTEGDTQVLPRLVIDEPTRALPLAVTPAEPEEPPAETAEQRLRRMVDSLARQEPGLRWAVGVRADGSTVALTDLAYGWVPPGIVLPSGTAAPAPAQRAAGLRGLLADTDTSARYSPGDPFERGRPTDPDDPPGELVAPVVEDLGWQLCEATRWRDGLPRLTHTLAKAATTGTGVAEAELDVLRVHLDTARYQLLARYPATDSSLLLNCLLLAATTALAAGDRSGANYHFAWFQEFTANIPPSS
jgi:hypothetical protein